MDIPRADGECAGAGGFCKDNQCLFFFFRTRGGDEGVASAPSAAYLHPGTAGGDGAGNHTCEGRLCRFGNGHSTNDALQKWKEGREKMQEAYHFIRTGLRNATGKDSLHLIRIRDSLRMQEQETNFLFLKEQGNNTLGTFMRKMVRGSLTEEQQKLLDESLQKEIH